MPDSNNDLNIVIRNEVDAAKVRQLQLEFEREMENARHIDHPPHSVPDLILEGERGEIPVPQNPSAPRTNTLTTKVQPPVDASLPGMLVGLVKDSIRSARQALGLQPRPADAQNPNVKPQPNQTNTPPQFFGPFLPNSTNAPATNGPNQLPSLPGTNVSRIPITANPVPSNRAATDSSLDTANPFDATNDLARTVSTQSQSLQSSADRLRSAVEQNTSITNALFARTLELFDQQNRRLGDVDRKLSELASQIKSLKNP